jgi:hypothetical protein
MKSLKQKTGHGLASFVLMFAMVGCAGIERSCSSCMAQSLGSDWIVVELREMDGTPYRCWQLKDTSISNEEGSDGIYWVTDDGNLVHVSGSYDRVQVENGQWDEAFAEINMTREACRQVNQARYDVLKGKYVTPAERKAKKAD